MAEPGHHYRRTKAGPIAEEDRLYRRFGGDYIAEPTMSYHRAWSCPTAESRQGLSPSTGACYDRATGVPSPSLGRSYHRDLGRPYFIAEPCERYHRAWPTLWPRPVQPYGRTALMAEPGESMSETRQPYGRALSRSMSETHLPYVRTLLAQSDCRANSASWSSLASSKAESPSPNTETMYPIAEPVSPNAACLIAESTQPYGRTQLDL
ncbi:hypothetical protein CALVIDRAFT_290331 [Calocera viscosa TUFC12733]|uniref:Uncharacterized protein n=1 Tax=Calocera viscosa (strain TUFC12733) TaxID=1330018 RepID=A0A167IR60_CALVF|nr:hypothetical protein CALVIDRAFT_290331 [Calocera viscosa TUFC12733]